MKSWISRSKVSGRFWTAGWVVVSIILLVGFYLSGDMLLLILLGAVLGAGGAIALQHKGFGLAAGLADQANPPGGSVDLPLSMVEYIQAVDTRLATNERQMEMEREEARRIAYELERLTDTVRRAATSDNVLALVKDIFAQSVDSYGAVIAELWLEEVWKSALGQTVHNRAVQLVQTPRGKPAVLMAAHGVEQGELSTSHSRGAPVLGVIDSSYRLTACDEQSLGWLFDRTWLASRNIRSFASFPLTIRGECIGAFAIFSKDILSDVFLGVLECCAQVLAMALADQRSLLDSRQITSRLEAANARQHEINNHLAETDRLKSEFLCTVSHELRTPLNGILGFLGLLRDGLAKDAQEQAEFVKNAYSSAEHLLTLIDDVLSLSEIEAGWAGLNLDGIDVVTSVESALQRFQKKAATKGLHLLATCSANPRALCDAARLDQILDKLLDNAIRFTPKGVVEVTVDEDGPMCRIEVRDTGVGIDPDLQSNLLGKFQQVDGSTKRRYSGTGLGLTLTRSLVQLMGGAVHLESAGKNLGTTVSIKLPLTPSGLTGLHPEWQGEAPFVLVLEDDIVAGTYLVRLLGKAGYRSTLIQDVEAARVCIRNNHPDLLCMDWKLSEDDKLEGTSGLVKEIYQSPETLPVVVVTGHEALASAFFEQENLSPEPPILMKPIDAGYFLRVVMDLTAPEHEKAA